MPTSRSVLRLLAGAAILTGTALLAGCIETHHAAPVPAATVTERTTTTTTPTPAPFPSSSSSSTTTTTTKSN